MKSSLKQNGYSRANKAFENCKGCRSNVCNMSTAQFAKLVGPQLLQIYLALLAKEQYHYFDNRSFTLNQTSECHYCVTHDTAQMF